MRNDSTRSLLINASSAKYGDSFVKIIVVEIVLFVDDVFVEIVEINAEDIVAVEADFTLMDMPLLVSRIFATDMS